MSMLRVPTASELEKYHSENVGQLLQVLLPLLDTFGISMEAKVDALATVLALWVEQQGVSVDGVHALIMLRVPYAKEYAAKGKVGEKPLIELLVKRN